MTLSLFRALRILAPAVVSILCLASPAAADKLADFKQAAANKGCDAIPYSSERSTCKSLSDAKDRACKDFSCPLDTFKKKLEELATKKKNLEEARSRKNESAAKDLEKAISALIHTVDDLARLRGDMISDRRRRGCSPRTCSARPSAATISITCSNRRLCVTRCRRSFQRRSMGLSCGL